MSDAKLDAYSPHEFAALLGDPRRYLSLDDGTLAEFLHLSIQLYGTNSMEILVEPVSTLYARAAHRVPLSARRAIHAAAVAGVRKGLLSVSAVLPFILAEHDGEIVSAAVLEYLMACPVLGDDPLSGVRDIVSILGPNLPGIDRRESNVASNRGAALGGLLLSGDRRAIAHIENLPEEFAINELINEAVRTQRGHIYSPVVDLYLGWLERLNHPSLAREFGVVAFGLIKLVQNNCNAVVEEYERDFGRRAGASAARAATQTPLRRYILELEPRLRAVAEAELAPRVMPLVLSAWRGASG